ncbi:MAG: Xenobiotic-transporting ATPase, partial [candidate division WS6 bacterium 34_10]
YIFPIILMIGLTYIQVMAGLQLPDYMATIVNDGIIQENQPLIWDTGLKMLLVTVVGAISTIAVGYIASKVGTGFGKSLRKDVFSKVESFSLTEFNKFSIASLITRSTNDIQQIQMVLTMMFRMVISAPITGILAVTKANQMAPSMTWIMWVAVVALMVVIAIMFVIALPKFEIIQKLIDKLNLVTRENLTGLRVIRAFNTEKNEEKKFDKVNRELMKVNLFVQRLMAFLQPAMMLILNLTTIAIIWIGSHLIETGNLQIGDMMAFMQYALQVIIAFLMVSMLFILIPRASVSAKRILEILETKPVIIDPKKPKKPKKDIRGVVEFKDVTFAYPDADVPVLQNISFKAKAGETTAIIGGTGSGKSTIVNLIPRFFDVTSGAILVDGVDIREMKQSKLREKIGYIPQKGVLFSGTVESNIKYGAPDIGEDEVRKAAEIAQASEFINKLGKKYKANIAQGGTNVSGGQKQRLSIARALATKPEIYIFDDSFSALDFKTASKLRKELKKETKDSTVIIVAQRISTILDADQIIVLEDGEIVGIGRHKELMKTSKVYREIALSQLSEQELNRE